MEARVSQSLQLSSWIKSDKVVRKPGGCLRFSVKWNEKLMHRTVISCHLQPRKANRRVALKVSCSSHNVQASVLESECITASTDEIETLKNKSEEVEEYLDGRCIYLVDMVIRRFFLNIGMMGSGKTTVGRILAETLGYSFFDCDRLIEQAVGGTTVAEIFKLHGESFFRDNERAYWEMFRLDSELPFVSMKNSFYLGLYLNCAHLLLITFCVYFNVSTSIFVKKGILCFKLQMRQIL
ncbi:shikimate kinase, chloroplastic-like isoform X3 [Nicotiana tabacum]|uniref:Shikimate kinase, chloroplastic-like isoform X3 n=1 Tax=Nicotiana tabacum TaxID=4097 RepID=A0AC58S5D8_TOBAC